MRLQQTSNGWVVDAPAKLNLFLEVLSKRADGYHDLESLMVAINLFDTVIVREQSSAEISLRCLHAGRLLSETNRASDEVPETPDNLVVRAGECLRHRFGIQSGIQIDLIKRIPAAAGMAGGSSDAAAVLVALNQIWKLGLTNHQLQEVAAEIGSDVCFLVSSAAMAVCQGRGEILRTNSMPLKLHFVIARPNSGLSTALVYRHCQPESQPLGVSKLLASLQR